MEEGGRPPSAVIDLWWINTFGTPPEDRDGVDEGRIWRAMEAQRLLKSAKSVTGFGEDLAELIEADPELVRELLNAKQD